MCSRMLFGNRTTHFISKVFCFFSLLRLENSHQLTIKTFISEAWSNLGHVNKVSGFVPLGKPLKKNPTNECFSIGKNTKQKALKLSFLV